MLFSVPFSHSARECPAADPGQMEAIRGMLAPDKLAARGIRLVEGYVDQL